MNKAKVILFAIPGRCRRLVGKPTIPLDETPCEDFGHHFVYPKPKAFALVNANNTPIPSMRAELAVKTTKPVSTLNESPVMGRKLVPLKAHLTTGEELAFGVPRTARPLPLIGPIGLLSPATAFGLSFAAKES
jgi:hypothetical protein